MTARDAFVASFDVPRETIEKLDIYVALLVEWQARMNLVAPSTLETMWIRHFADSAQVARLASPTTGAKTVWLDLGSGAGFPALVLAVLLPGQFHLVEATAKKCRFLETVVAALDLGAAVTVHNARIESIAPIDADVITARACASLAQLFAWGERHAARATWLLLKGRSYAAEIAAARALFTFTVDLVTSTTDDDARIVVARDVRQLRR